MEVSTKYPEVKTSCDISISGNDGNFYTISTEIAFPHEVEYKGQKCKILRVETDIIPKRNNEVRRTTMKHVICGRWDYIEKEPLKQETIPLIEHFKRVEKLERLCLN